MPPGSGPARADEMRVPFADSQGTGAAPSSSSSPSSLDRLYSPNGTLTGDSVLSRPHRQKDQIASWLEDDLSRLLTIENGAFDTHLATAHDAMDENGWAGYQDFLTQNKIGTILEGHRVDLKSYVTLAPLLLNEGVVDGRYRWLFETPMVMSFLPSGTKDYKNVTPTNWHVKIFTQVGRVAPGKAPDDLMIESWQVEILPMPQS